jgi:hypothetical protein
MKFSVPIKFGNRVITIEDEAEDMRDMFRKMDSYDSLPSEGPSGEDDLEFCHRVVKNGKGQPCTYYSIVCPSAGQEFKFGILADGSGLFPKGWEHIQRGAYRERHEEAEEQPEPKPSASEGPKRVERRESQRSKPDPAGDLKPSESVNLDVRAAWLVEQGRVSKTDNGYAVKPNDKVTYEIWRNQANKVVCNCDRFDKVRESDPEFRCEHIRAVKLFTTPRQVAA